MSRHADTENMELTRAEIDRSEGPVVLEFGASWCGHCQAMAPHLLAVLDAHPAVNHIKVEDGPGRPLGRSFGVKLWPTLVFLRDGKVCGQVSRPNARQIAAGFLSIDPGLSEFEDQTASE